MTPVFLALGSNIEPRRHFLQKAVELLVDRFPRFQLAPLYETSPYGKTDQPYFFNSALYLEVDMPPHDLLQWLKEIEKQVGRRQRERWGPREIDIDIIFYSDWVLHSDSLTIPHPEYSKRRFVLQPLVDIAPHWVPPDRPVPLVQLLQQCNDSTSIRLIEKRWFHYEEIA